MTTGERIRKRREELGLTQTDLAERMGYKSRAAICTVEKDKEDLTSTRIRRFAEALQTTPSYLMGWEDEDTIEEKITELPLTPNEMNEALRFYSYYKKLNPNDQTAIKTLLESLRPES